MTELTNPSTDRRLRVLVVDDEAFNRDLVRDSLADAGVRVITAEDGQAGLEIARLERPALILMDIGMPRMDGLRAARELKDDPRTSDIPLVAITACALPEDERRARAAGFDAFLAKPFPADALDRVVARYLKALGPAA